MVDGIIDNFSDFRQFRIEDVTVIDSPAAFCSMVLEKARTSSSVYLACLVLGLGDHTRMLLDILEERMLQNRKTVVLVDKSRNLRDAGLVEYLNKKGLWSIIKTVDSGKCSILPHALNEFLGVYHLKAYIFDDEVCISGANLNNSYFVDRIDRYYLIKNRQLSLSMISSVFNEEVLCPAGHRDIENSITNPHRRMDAIDQMHLKTRLFNFTESQEIDILERLLKYKFTEIVVSTAYLNFTNEHIRILKPHPFKLFSPAPKANTFNDFSWLGQFITEVYSYSNYRTMRYLPRCRLYEYYNEGYSFHTKGLWLFGDGCCATIVGSTNFNQRSIKIDRECSWAIISNDPKIEAKMRKEVEEIERHSERAQLAVLARRRFSLLVYIMYYLFNIFF